MRSTGWRVLPNPTGFMVILRSFFQREEYALATQRVIEAQASTSRLAAETSRLLAEANTAAPPIPATVAPSAADAGVVAATAVAAVQEAFRQVSNSL